MRHNISFFILAFVLSFQLSAQEEFKIVKELKHTPVISQGSTGTCWSFATTSFLESEIMRKGFPETDLSEMFFVNYAYQNKTREYLLYHGKNNFGEGGLAHDVLSIVRDFGIVTEESYPGEKVDGIFNHNELIKELRVDIEELNTQRRNFDASEIGPVISALDKYIGKIPRRIRLESGNLSPQEFRDMVELNPDDYIEITSFTHHPFYKRFVLEIPDNWAHGLYYNLPIDELVEVMKYSIENGYTLCWDCDMSERTFSNSNGQADLPDSQIGKATQELRQETFFDRSTTDDHLMHVVGISENSEGRTFFYTKNSWGGNSNEIGGYMHISEDYVRLKTISILVHKDAVPENIKVKLNSADERI